MGIVAYLTYADGWTLSAPAGTYAFQSFDEAVTAARRLLGPHGGGTVYVSAGAGIEATTLRIQPHPAAAHQAPAVAALRPVEPPMPPEPPPPAPLPTPAPPTGDFGEQVLALCASYHHADEEIGAIADPVERNLGQGTLRLEAIEVLQRLQGGQPAPSRQDLQPLIDTVGSLSGGKSSELVVKGIDAAGRQVLKEFRKSLLAMELTAGLSLLASLVISYVTLSGEMGQGFAVALLGGSSAAIVIFRHALLHLPDAARDTFTETASWALQIGSRTATAMKEPRQIQQRLLTSRAALPPSQYKPLTEHAHHQAVIIVAIFWICVAIGAASFLIGGVVVFDKALS